MREECRLSNLLKVRQQSFGSHARSRAWHVRSFSLGAALGFSFQREKCLDFSQKFVCLRREWSCFVKVLPSFVSKFDRKSAEKYPWIETNAFFPHRKRSIHARKVVGIETQRDDLLCLETAFGFLVLPRLCVQNGRASRF